MLSHIVLTTLRFTLVIRKGCTELRLQSWNSYERVTENDKSKSGLSIIRPTIELDTSRTLIIVKVKRQAKWLMFGADCTCYKHHNDENADRVLCQPLANAISIHSEYHKPIHIAI
jgi:hypothetical protein